MRALVDCGFGSEIAAGADDPRLSGEEQPAMCVGGRAIETDARGREQRVKLAVVRERVVDAKHTETTVDNAPGDRACEPGRRHEHPDAPGRPAVRVGDAHRHDPHRAWSRGAHADRRDRWMPRLCRDRRPDLEDTGCREGAGGTAECERRRGDEQAAGRATAQAAPPAVPACDGGAEVAVARGRRQIGRQALGGVTEQPLELRQHAHASCSSCSRSRERPRLTRWRATSSEHCSRSATSA